MRVNLGCGQTPTAGWTNLDNSWSIRLAKIPFLPQLLKALHIVGRERQHFMSIARLHRVEYADVTRGLPLSNGSVEVLYSSHVLEHLDGDEASMFLKEARRILKPGAIIRFAVPDLERQIQSYLEHKDADDFVRSTFLSQPRPRTILQRVRFMLVGGRHHYWMYDGHSLCRLLNKHGFVNAAVISPGETRIPNPGALDLYERASESVYVEAEAPG